ncbi:Uncharacterised protein [Collinsella intestinalis]|nr:Uncharacterised protein [Collinsella intestinalis]
MIGFDDLEDRRPLLDGFLLDDNPLDIRIFVGGIGLGQVDSRHPGLELGGAHCGRRAEIDRPSCVLTFGLLGLLALHAFDGQLILCTLLHLMRIGGLGVGSGLCSGDGLFEDALLLGKILVGRLIGRELLAHLVRGDGVHDAEHGRDGGLVAHGARGVGQEEAIGDDGDAVRKRNQGSHDGEHPQDDLCRIGQRKHAHDGKDSGGDHASGKELHDERTVRGEGLGAQQVGARRVVVRHNDHRAVAGRCERARGLVVGDDVLAQTAGTEVGKNRATGALEDEENRCGDSDQQAHNAGRPADAGEHGADEHRDAEAGLDDLRRTARAELLHLGREAMVGKDLRDHIRGGALFLAASRGDTGVLKQMAQVFLRIRHVDSTSNSYACKRAARTTRMYSRQYTLTCALPAEF